MPTPSSFDLQGPLPRGRTVIEASAGTGKTYTIAALATRYVAGETTAGGSQLGPGVGVDQLLVVTFTRAAASELRDRIRTKLRLALATLDGAPALDSDAWLATLLDGPPGVRRLRAARLRDALARFDEATITTIHGFCQQALTQAGLRAAGDPDASLVESTAELVAEVGRDLLVRELAGDPYAFATDSEDRPIEFLDDGRGARVIRRDGPTFQPRPTRSVERYFGDAVTTLLTNAGSTAMPAPAIGGIAGRWSALVNEAVAEITARQRERRLIGYDRLVSDLASLLADPVSGRALARQLAARYQLVLVDEFQDTDRLQWGILNRAFGARALVTVGDPKQAIYRFRGADVHAYLDAVRSASPATLGTNFRSDRRLLDALAVLCDGAQLGHPDIAVHPVDAAPNAARGAITELTPSGKLDRRLRAAIHVRVVDHPDVHRTRDGMEAGEVQRIVLGDVASRIRNLLDHATIDTGGGARPVRPEDVAVLVPSQRRAADTAELLREWGIPSVRARTGSVLQTDAAMQWRLLIAGLAAPARARMARAAGLSWFFDVKPADLRSEPLAGTDDVTADSPLVRLQQRLAVLAHRLRAHGVGPFYEELRSESPLLDVVLGAPGGDRNLADLDHIADLLVAELRGHPSEPRHVQQTLDRLIADADAAVAGEDTMRRIETDDDAVHITTIHAAKGLEFPIVLLPFSYTERQAASRPYVYNIDGTRVVDVSSWVAWAEGDGAEPIEEGSKPAKAAWRQRKALANAEVDGDGLRALYVAMTRARHRLEIWWAPTRRAATSALGRLLLDRDGAGPLANSPVDDDYCKHPERASAQIASLAQASNGTIATFDVPIDQPVRRPLAMGASAALPLAVADGTSRHPLADPSWRTWSFTAVSAATSGREHARAANEVPAVGGADEEPAELDEDLPVGPGATAEPLLDQSVGGTTFGIVVHGVLEQLDFTSPTLLDDVSALTADALAAAGLAGAVELDGLTTGLVAAIETPLGPRFGGRALAQLAPFDRLAELTFDLRLAAGIAASDIGKALADTLAVDDPLRRYADELVAALEPVTLAGWLTGSIDAVFRVDGRYVVVDYKTNRLQGGAGSSPLDAYRPDLLVAAMCHSNYPLQALLYEVALHRYLRWRLGAGYDPAVHLGGVGYLFVRGMVGPATPTIGDDPYGVFSWQPPVATIAALDTLLVARR